MTKKEFIRIINKAGTTDMEHALNLMSIALEYMAREDQKQFPKVAEYEWKRSNIIHEELKKIGFYNY